MDAQNIIEDVLDGLAEGFNNDPELSWTGREVAETVELVKARVAGRLSPDVTVNRHVLSGLLYCAATGQDARAARLVPARSGMARDLQANADALRTLAERLDAGIIADISVSGALDRILAA